MATVKITKTGIIQNYLTKKVSLHKWERTNYKIILIHMKLATDRYRIDLVSVRHLEFKMTAAIICILPYFRKYACQNHQNWRIYTIRCAYLFVATRTYTIINNCCHAIRSTVAITRYAHQVTPDTLCMLQKPEYEQYLVRSVSGLSFEEWCTMLFEEQPRFKYCTITPSCYCYNLCDKSGRDHSRCAFNACFR